MVQHRRTQIPQSTSSSMSSRTNLERLTRWTTMHRGTQPTSSISPRSSFVCRVGAQSHLSNFLLHTPDTDLDKAIPRVVHYSAGECLTKYSICEIFGKILKLPINHIIRDSAVPADAVARPRDCHLSTDETVELAGELGCSNFEEWWSKYLTSAQPK